MTQEFDASRRLWLARAGALSGGIAGGLARPAGAQTSAAASPAADAAVAEARAPALPAEGNRVAVPAIELLDGSRFDPAQAEGQVLLLYWWASWCPFCALTSPHVDKLWQAQRGRGLQMLALSIDKRADEARVYLSRRGYRWPAAWITPAFQQALPKPKGLPVTLVRGRTGRVLQAEAGQLFPEDVEALARHL